MDFNTHEIATAIWVSLILILLFSRAEIRPLMLKVIERACVPRLIVPVLLAGLAIGVFVCILSRLEERDRLPGRKVV